MSFLDINPDEQDQILERLYSTPNVEPQPPGLITGHDIYEPFKGLAGGLTKVEALSQDVQSLATRPLYRGLDAILGTSIEEDNERQRQQLHEAIRYFAPDPERTGYAGRVLNGIFDVGPRAIAGFAMGGPLGAAAAAGGPAGYASFLEGKEVQHLDTATAAGKGAIEGVFTGAMTAIPASVGAKLLPNALLYGPAINIAQGTLARGIVHEWLDMQGYHDVAAQYKWLDAEGIAIDAVLGSAFGALGAKHWERPSKPLPSEIDAALTANEAQHVEIDTAPGIPHTLNGRQAHTEATQTAMNQLLMNEPVNVEDIIADTDFLPKPQEEAAMEAFSKVLEEGGYGHILKGLEQPEPVALPETAIVPDNGIGGVDESLLVAGAASREAAVSPAGAVAAPTAPAALAEPAVKELAKLPSAVLETELKKAPSEEKPAIEQELGRRRGFKTTVNVNGVEHTIEGTIPTPEGESIRAREAIDKADAELANATDMGRAFEIAMNCYIKNGAT